MENPDKVITDLRTIAWLDFLDWASRQKDLIAQFKKDTGETIIPLPTSALAVLIDEATGAAEHNKKVMKKFVVWVTENYWGQREAPALYFEKFNPLNPPMEDIPS